MFYLLYHHINTYPQMQNSGLLKQQFSKSVSVGSKGVTMECTLTLPCAFIYQNTNDCANASRPLLEK